MEIVCRKALKLHDEYQLIDATDSADRNVEDSRWMLKKAFMSLSISLLVAVPAAINISRILTNYWNY